MYSAFSFSLCPLVRGLPTFVSSKFGLAEKMKFQVEETALSLNAKWPSTVLK